MTSTPLEDLQTVTLTVNGSERTVAVPATRTLLDGTALDQSLDRLLSAATPISDVRGSREYRLATLRVLAKRAVLAAADRRNPQEMAS